MKSLLVLGTALLALLASSTPAVGQSALAQIQYEEAEEAFSRNDLRTAHQKLNEAERTFGRANAPILRLRIIVLEQAVRTNPNNDFSVLDALRRDCRTYTTSFANDQRWIDYTREVHPLCQGLSQYPATRQAWEAAQQAERDRVARAQAAERQRQERERQVQTRQAQERLLQIEPQIAHHERWETIHDVLGFPQVLGGGVGTLIGLAVIYSGIEFEDDEDLLWGLGITGVSVLAILNGLRHLDLGVDHMRRARELRGERERLARVVAVSPTYAPRQNAFGIAAVIRF